MKVAILGASGMLGSMLVDVLSKQFEVVATVRNKDYIMPIDNVEWKQFDASDKGDSLARIVDGCDWVINAIGIIPQRHPSSYYINKELPYRLSMLSSSYLPVIQIATDCVFSGKQGNYNEFSPHDALDAYGLSKSDGEAISVHYTHIRCSIVGPERHGNYSLLGWFLSQPEGAEINGYTNHFWNGVTTLHFAKVCGGIIGGRAQPLFIQHLVPADTVSKHELLLLFRKYFNRTDITIYPCEAPKSVDRTLVTTSSDDNRKLWAGAEYSEPPSIEQMVSELAEYWRDNWLKK